MYGRAMAPATPRRGRLLTPLDPDASHAARLGAELRALRLTRGLTLQALGALAGYASQHISSVERAIAPATRPFIAACDAALEADGALLAFLPAALEERALERDKRTAARRADHEPALRCVVQDSEVVGEDVDPTNRRGLIGAAGAGALGLGAAATPAAARDVDPELPAYWSRQLSLLHRHDGAFGPCDVLAIVRHELRRIAEHRKVARGELRAELLRVEARWAELAAWLSNDTGDLRRRGAWTDRTLWLAREAGDPDSIALARMRQGQWAIQEHDASRAVAFAEAALAVTGTSAQTRARCALRAAHARALANDATACERHLAVAAEGADSGVPFPFVTASGVRANEARCWLWMSPAKAIPLYERALREWPRDRVRDGGLHQARLALACAATGERDRAEAEGRKALAIARSTKSAVAARELHRLREALSAN
jgi:transcriptional regulator with XRE-family HTH domain